MIKIYVGTYAKYNDGNLFGEWFDLSLYSSIDDFYNDCKELHQDEEDPEFMFQDYEYDYDFEKNYISECHLDEEYFDLWDEIERRHINPKALESYYNYFGNCDFDYFEECYRGQASSLANYCEQEAEDLNELENVPDYIKYAIDWEIVARDSDYIYQDGFVFLNC